MTIFAALRALLRRLFGRPAATPPPPRTMSRDEVEHIVMRHRRELGKRTGRR